jgi:hypothetical protein
VRAVVDTSGTWLAGKEGPAAMIMPAGPRIGDVNRPENTAWKLHRSQGVPARLAAPTGRALRELARVVAIERSRKRPQCGARPRAEVERARSHLRARQARLDAVAGRRSALAGDVAALQWIRDGVALARIDTRLEELRPNVADRELGAVMRTAAAFGRALKQAPVTGSASGLSARYQAPAARRG